MQENVQLSNVLWYKIGGKARYVLFAHNEKDVEEAVQFILAKKLSFFVVGIGANLLFNDEDYNGAVIILKGLQEVLVQGKQVAAFAGILLDEVIQSSFAHNLVGLGWAGGLPSTVGAAVRGNVGAFGSEIKNVVKNIRCIQLTKDQYTFIELSNEQLDFSYRSSLIKKDRSLIVVSVTFQLQEGNADDIVKEKEIYEKNIAYRKIHHPMEYPNTGSCFKNISKKEEVEKVLTVYPDIKEMVEGKWHGKVSMGYLNKRLGFAGFTIGGAQVSTQHANFIDNIGGAKASDVCAIIAAIQDKFQQTYGFIPEPEVEIVR